MDIFLFIVWICFGIIGSMIASNKGNSGCGGLILGIMLGPLGLLISFFSTDNEERKNKQMGNTKCPNCAEYVKTEAIICKHCGSNLNDDSGFDIEKYRK